MTQLGLTALILIHCCATMYLGAQVRQTNVLTQRDYWPRIAGATLMVGAPYDLTLTTGTTSINLQPHDVRAGSRMPSISRDRKTVAFALIHVAPDYSSSRSVVSTMALESRNGEWEGQWVEHPEISFETGVVAISPDGSKIACSRRNRVNSWNLQVVDLRTGEVLVGPEFTQNPGQEISWSPDGRRIAFEMLPAGDSTSNIYTIYIFDLEMMAVTPLTVGHSPAWSPSGEIIAYVAYAQDKKQHSATWCLSGVCYKPWNIVTLIKPDGSEARVLMSYTSYVFGAGPVWSPDSNTLLVNKSHDAEIASFDIYLIDIATGKRTLRFKNTGIVSGWVAAP